MECTSAFYAHAAPLPARPTGGTKTNTLGQLLLCKRTGGLLTLGCVFLGDNAVGWISALR